MREWARIGVAVQDKLLIARLVRSSERVTLTDINRLKHLYDAGGLRTIVAKASRNLDAGEMAVFRNNTDTFLGEGTFRDTFV